MNGGHDAHAEINGAAAHFQFEATVLGLALFSDVQFAHDLDAADDGGSKTLINGIGRGIEAAINAIFDKKTCGGGFQVDV